MEINVSQSTGRTPVTILQLAGTLDTSTYQELIVTARNLQNAGAHNLLLDLSGLTYISSAGLAALHMLTKMFPGEAPNASDGQEADGQPDRERGFQGRVKLFKPSPEVDAVLDTTGFKQFFEIYTDMDAALQSYHNQ
ncbi:MAG: STAS domain-containing protein [Chloroflexota bacterium]